MTDPLFGIMTRIVGVQWGSAYAVISCVLNVLPADTATASLTGANISVSSPHAVGGAALPIASSPPGASGDGTDFKTLSRSFKIWRSPITVYDAGGSSFCFILVPLSYYPGGTVQLSFGTAGRPHSLDVSCIVTDSLKAFAVNTATTEFAFQFDDGNLNAFLDFADMSAALSAQWGAKGFIKSAASMQLAGSFGSNNGIVAIDAANKRVHMTNQSPAASVFNWP